MQIYEWFCYVLLNHNICIQAFWSFLKKYGLYKILHLTNFIYDRNPTNFTSHFDPLYILISVF
jgi:hypothetical protein